MALPHESCACVRARMVGHVQRTMLPDASMDIRAKLATAILRDFLWHFLYLAMQVIPHSFPFLHFLAAGSARVGVSFSFCSLSFFFCTESVTPLVTESTNLLRASIRSI